MWKIPHTFKSLHLREALKRIQNMDPHLKDIKKNELNYNKHENLIEYSFNIVKLYYRAYGTLHTRGDQNWAGSTVSSIHSLRLITPS